MPLAGALIAIFSCLIASKNINCDFVNVSKNSVLSDSNLSGSIYYKVTKDRVSSKIGA